jgi:hypothetical protein
VHAVGGVSECMCVCVCGGGGVCNRQKKRAGKLNFQGHLTGLRWQMATYMYLLLYLNRNHAMNVHRGVKLQPQIFSTLALNGIE